MELLHRWVNETAPIFSYKQYQQKADQQLVVAKLVIVEDQKDHTEEQKLFKPYVTPEKPLESRKPEGGAFFLIAFGDLAGLLGYYPYCDCEDRSILFSRLVRDLMGLDVVLIYYPGHLATAVKFSSEVKGDYITYQGDRYTVCDPTYINAPVGMTMPDMDNASAFVVVL